MVTFLFDSVFTWVIVVPAAYLLAHFTGLGIVSIYFLVQGTELIKVIIGYLMVKSNVWVVQMVLITICAASRRLLDGDWHEK